MAVALLHTLRRIPASLHLPKDEDLSRVVGVVGRNPAERGRPGLQRLLVRASDQLLQLAQNPIKLLPDLVPASLVEGVERLVVVAVEFRRSLSSELGQLLRVPEQQMVRQLADGVVSTCLLYTSDAAD